MTWLVRRGVLELGDLALERGGTLPNARLVWQAHGALNPARDNAVLYPCSYRATTDDLSWLIGPDSVLDPTRWCVIVPGMFGEKNVKWVTRVELVDHDVKGFY